MSLLCHIGVVVAVVAMAVWQAGGGSTHAAVVFLPLGIARRSQCTPRVHPSTAPGATWVTLQAREYNLNNPPGVSGGTPL